MRLLLISNSASGSATIVGTGRVKLFQRGREPRWFLAGQEVELEPPGK